MKLHNAILSFANLLEVAQLCASGGNIYETQEMLIAECREQKRPFPAIMPLRHQFQCALCLVTQGEAELHFEDPSHAPASSGPAASWLTPVGRSVMIERSVLHGILAHDDAAPAELMALLSNVGADPGDQSGA